MENIKENIKENTKEEYFKKLRGSNTYILSDSLSDRKRLALQVNLYASTFKRALGQAIDKFGLRAALQDPTATFRVLDLGCGEGLYIPVVNDWLKEQGAKARIKLIGVDREPLAIATGTAYLAALGLTNAELYTHDLTRPWSEFNDLDMSQPENHFDLIYASVVFMHLPDVSQIVQSTFELLKPGGAFYTKDMTWLDGGMNYPSPTLTELSEIVRPIILGRLREDFASQHKPFLEKAGFEGVESFEDSYPIGGQTEGGRRMLEIFLLGQHALRPLFIQLGLMDGAEYDRRIAQEFQEITPQLEGRLTMVNTVARRPILN